LDEIKVETQNLYREETFTDLKVATLKQLTPINTDGSRDLSRPVIFMAQTQLMSQVGPLPVNCVIEADTLQGAIDQFPEAIQTAVGAMIEEVKEMQRKEMSRIVVPGAETASKILGGS
jgi:hypothetical protein